jgi:hypothetical protein
MSRTAEENSNRRVAEGRDRSTLPQVVASRLVACICFDLGGYVTNWRRLIERLEHAGWSGVGPWESEQGALQVAYRVTHCPTLLVEEGPVELAIPIPGIRESWRTAKIFPSGILSFRYTLDCGDLEIGDLYAIKRHFTLSNKGRYVDYLRAAYESRGLGADRLNDLDEHPDTYGIEVVSDARGVRSAIQFDDVLEFRPGIHFPLLARYALCVGPRPARDRLESDLAALARAKGLEFPANDLGGLLGPDERLGARVRALPSATIASWEGFETYIACENEVVLEKVLDAFELSHHFAFLCRAWTEVLDELEPLESPRSVIGASEIQELEDRLLYLAELQQQITESLVEMDSGDVMLLDPVQLQLVSDFRERFFIERAKRMVFDRLDALDRQTAVIRDVLDRSYQEASRRQAEYLQLLFGGAVAASITALIPATADNGVGSLTRAVTWGATAVIWVALVLIVLRLLRLKIGVRLHARIRPRWLAQTPSEGSREGGLQRRPADRGMRRARRLRSREPEVTSPSYPLPDPATAERE